MRSVPSGARAPPRDVAGCHDGHKTFIEEWQQIDDPAVCTNSHSLSSSADDTEDEQLPREELSPQENFRRMYDRRRYMEKVGGPVDPIFPQKK